MEVSGSNPFSPWSPDPIRLCLLYIMRYCSFQDCVSADLRIPTCIASSAIGSAWSFNVMSVSSGWDRLAYWSIWSITLLTGCSRNLSKLLKSSAMLTRSCKILLFSTCMATSSAQPGATQELSPLWYPTVYQVSGAFQIDHYYTTCRDLYWVCLPAWLLLNTSE